MEFLNPAPKIAQLSTERDMMLTESIPSFEIPQMENVKTFLMCSQLNSLKSIPLLVQKII
jgi:hypothetical protein